MKRLPVSSVQHRGWLLVACASIAGGLAELAWVSFYGALTSTNLAEVARQITVSFSHELGATPMAPLLGILIHLVLALVMGCAYALLIWQPFARRAGMAATLLSAALALAAVWAVNFLVLLPALNPAFVALLPYVVTFASKMWFALALAGVLIAGSRQNPAGQPLGQPAGA